MNKLFQKRKAKVRTMKVNSVKEAWGIANRLFPTDYRKSYERSERAGYDIYVSTADNNESWISDLGKRLEINVVNENGTKDTINIQIEETKTMKATVRSLTGKFEEHELEGIVTVQFVAGNLLLTSVRNDEVYTTRYGNKAVMVEIH